MWTMQWCGGKNPWCLIRMSWQQFAFCADWTDWRGTAKHNAVLDSFHQKGITYPTTLRGKLFSTSRLHISLIIKNNKEIIGSRRNRYCFHHLLITHDPSFIWQQLTTVATNALIVCVIVSTLLTFIIIPFSLFTYSPVFFSHARLSLSEA